MPETSDDTLSTEDGYTTVTENIPDAPSPVVVRDVPEWVALGIAEGRSLIADSAKRSDGSDPSRSTRLGFAYRESNDPLDQFQVIDDPPSRSRERRLLGGFEATEELHGLAGI